jgi:peptidoglycan-associated lipoprotein
MTNRALSVVMMLSVAVLAVLLFGCARRPSLAAVSGPAPAGAARVEPGYSVASAPAPLPPEPSPNEQSSAAVATPEPAAAPGRPAPRDFAAVRDLRDIHFDFDRYEIRPDSAKTLEANARWLKANPERSVLIEGHCDERGTSEYNLALGDRRATATRSYLVAQGVKESRITTISYGKERPRCAEPAESCWSENRRAHLVLDSR